MSTYEISKSSVRICLLVFTILFYLHYILQLLSLKAEISRKQQELIKARADNEVKIKVIKKNTPLEIKNKGIEARQKNDITEEEADLLRQSKYVRNGD